MVFVCHENQPSGCVPGVAHGEANDKSTIRLVSMCNKRLCCLKTERKLYAIAVANFGLCKKEYLCFDCVTNPNENSVF